MALHSPRRPRLAPKGSGLARQGTVRRWRWRRRKGCPIQRASAWRFFFGSRCGRTHHMRLPPRHSALSRRPIWRKGGGAAAVHHGVWTHVLPAQKSLGSAL